jgi:hypothetical protein
MARRNTRPKERKRRNVLRYIPQEDVAETKELVKEKLPDLPRKKDKRSPRSPMLEESPVAPEQMLPELDEFRGELFERFGGKKGKKKRRERIKKNVKKGWKELGLLEKRGLA